MIVQGTKKIRGAITVGLKYQMESGKIYSLTDEETKKPEVQLAIKHKFLKIIDSHKARHKSSNEYDAEQESNTDTVIICKNTYDKELSFKQFDFSMNPGSTFSLDESDLTDPAIQAAISKKMITIMGSENPKNSDEDVPVIDINVSEHIEKHDKQKKKQERIDSSGVQVSKFSGLSAVNEEELGLQQNQEVSIDNVINHPDPDPITSSDIADPKQVSLAWDPTGDGPNINTMKEGQVWDSQQQKLTMAENIEEGTGGSSKNSDEISFVDKEQEEERIAKNPQLKTLKEDDDIIFVDEEQESQKIKEFEKTQKKTEIEPPIKRKRGRPRKTSAKKSTKKTGTSTEEFQL